MKEPAFTLVIPCYNEAEGLPALVERVAFLSRAGGGEVILVDNGSTDDSPGVLEKLLLDVDGDVRSIRVEPNEGYGHGILAGLREARGPIVGWTHADLQSDPLDVLKALPLFEGSPRLFVKGRRFGRSTLERIFTGGLSVIASLQFRTVLREIYAQPTLFDRQFMDEWTDAPPKDFAFELFVLVSAKRSGRTISRIPVLFPPRLYGESSWNDGMAARLRFSRRNIGYCRELRKRFSEKSA